MDEGLGWGVGIPLLSRQAKNRKDRHGDRCNRMVLLFIAVIVASAIDVTVTDCYHYCYFYVAATTVALLT